MKRVLFTHAQIHNGRIDYDQILHIHFLGGLSDIFESPSTFVQGFFFGGGVQNLASPINFSIGF